MRFLSIIFLLFSCSLFDTPYYPTNAELSDLYFVFGEDFYHSKIEGRMYWSSENTGEFAWARPSGVYFSNKVSQDFLTEQRALVHESFHIFWNRFQKSSKYDVYPEDLNTPDLLTEEQMARLCQYYAVYNRMGDDWSYIWTKEERSVLRTFLQSLGIKTP